LDYVNNKIMSEGYVVFVNNNKLYIDLLDVLIESILLFSNKKIEVFSINFAYHHSSPRVINKKILIKNECFATICYSKLYSSFNSEFDYGIQLDSDFIITDKMDNLFDDCKKINLTPLGSLHPTDPGNQQDIMDFFDVKVKTQPYVHATYLFSNSCKLFLEECYNQSQILFSKNITPANYDETILNVMLWKEKSNSWVDTYDPYYEFFIDRDNLKIKDYNWMDNVNFYSCHGIKDSLYAKQILEKIKCKIIG
jgi:hypothetical protein